jgi:hypothetical protein
MIYTFRFISDEEDDFIIDININHNQTFEDLHNTIQKTLNFDNTQLASFYTSNEEWEKLDEIPYIQMGEDSGIKTMKEQNIGEIYTERDEQILYIYDFLNERLLFGKLIRIINAESPIELPSVSKLEGTIPQQTKEVLDIKDIIYDEEFDDGCFTKDDFDSFDDFDDPDDYYKMI